MNANDNAQSGSQQPLVIITGASGLIGSRIIARLGQNYRLVGLDVMPPSAGKIHFIETDLTDDASVTHALTESREKFGAAVASVIHLAAYYDFSGEPSPMYDKLTVEGTRRLLRELHRRELNVEQFVFSSSLLVMEPDEKGRHISELSQTRAEWAYPQSKLRAEEVIREERGQIPVVILRLAGVYDEHCHSVPISQQIARIYEKQLASYVFPGDASHGQALVHLDDVARCFENVVERRRQLDKLSICLIAEPDVMSYEELQDELGELIHGREWPTIRIPKTVAKVGAWIQEKTASSEKGKPFIKPWMIDLADDHYAAMISRARSELEWEPAHRLRDVLPEMIEFLKRDPDGFYRENKLAAAE
ncbi:MAG: NAD(P)-dependent oxidoreductase [Planctomycetaceae bacterium]